MTSRKSKAMIGLFVTGAIALICVVMIIFGSGSFNSNTVSFVLYFDSSVRGLTNGAAVYFNGVRVGKVTSMAISQGKDNLTFATPVIIELEKFSDVDNDQVDIPDLVDYMGDPNMIDVLIKNGLRAKLTTSSFITGLLVIDLAIVPNAPPIEISSLESYEGIPQIPTMPSGIDSMLTEFENLPIADIAAEALSTLKNINKSLNEMQLAQISKELQIVMVTLDKTLIEYKKIGNSLNNNMDSLLKNADSALYSVDRMAKNGSSILQDNSATMQELSQTMLAIRQAATSISYLAKLLEKKPDALIFGKDR